MLQVPYLAYIMLAPYTEANKKNVIHFQLLFKEMQVFPPSITIPSDNHQPRVLNTVSAESRLFDLDFWATCFSRKKSRLWGGNIQNLFPWMFPCLHAQEILNFVIEANQKLFLKIFRNKFASKTNTPCPCKQANKFFGQKHFCTMFSHLYSPVQGSFHSHLPNHILLRNETRTQITLSNNFPLLQ